MQRYPADVPILKSASRLTGDETIMLPEFAPPLDPTGLFDRCLESAEANGFTERYPFILGTDGGDDRLHRRLSTSGETMDGHIAACSRTCSKIRSAEGDVQLAVAVADESGSNLVREFGLKNWFCWLQLLDRFPLPFA
jgi:hypothetical protein